MKVFIGFLAGVLSTVTMVVGFMVGGAFGYMIGQDTPKRIRPEFTYPYTKPQSYYRPSGYRKHSDQFEKHETGEEEV